MRFLVAIDSSVGSQHALEKAIQLAQPLEATLVLLTVVEPIIWIYYPNTVMMPIGNASLPGHLSDPSEVETAIKQGAETTLQASQHRCEQAGITCVTRIERGAPREVICTIAASENPDVLIIGSRGLGNFDRLMLGSVSDYVVHHATCPVMVVR